MEKSWAALFDNEVVIRGSFSFIKTVTDEHHHRRHPDNTSLSHAANGLCSQFVGGRRKHTTTSVDNELDATAPNTLHNVLSLAAQSIPRTVPFQPALILWSNWF